MRNTLYNLFIIIILASFFTNCKKSALPDDVLEPVVFSISANINGQAENVTTDVAKGHYMYAAFGMDTATNVMVLNGTLAPPNCSNGDCPGSLRFEFRNFETGNNVNIDELIRETEYLYTNTTNFSQGKTEYLLQLEAQNTGGIQAQYGWAIPGIGDFKGKIIDTVLPNAEDRTRRLSCTFNGNNSLITRTIAIDTVFGATFPRAGISLLLDSSANSIEAKAFPFQSNLKYVWMNGDTTPSIITETDVSEFFVTTIDTKSQKNASAQLIVNQPLSPTKPLETIDFKETITKKIIPGSLELGKVAIQWMSKDGVLWRSDRRTQVSDNFFTVRDISPYTINEKQQKTYKIWVDFKCTLYNKDGQSIPASGSGFIAVAYPG
jgi:hypothetical protein